MKKITKGLLIAGLVLSMAACSEKQELSSNTITQPNSITMTPEPEQGESTEVPTEGDMNIDGKETNILIAYFTWAENTVVENPEDIDLDATTSASVLPPGNAAKMAGWIEEYTGGDLFSIKVTEPYSSDYDECLNRAADEKAENARPELVGNIENMDDYDTIFLGFPNWWYTVPMAIHSFLEEYDFSGKTVIPFVMHGTGGLSRTIHDITDALPETVTILEPIGIYRSDVAASQPTVEEWLRELGFVKKTEAEEDKPENNTEKRIIMTVDRQDISIVLYDTPAANALYEMLPMELNFEDYNGIEKISYLSETLPTEGEPSGCDPTVGDVCLYAPWGNLSIFYEDFRQSEGLIRLGYIETGMELLADRNSDFTAVLRSSQTPDDEPQESEEQEESEAPKVYMTTDISSEGLIKVYEALNAAPEGRIAVKLSTGEPGSNYLRTDLIGELVQSFENPTIVECNTAYGGSRANTAMHYQVAKDHGYTDIAEVDIMDENGSMTLTVTGGDNLTENYVGASFAEYDYYVVLSHFKGHAMAGFGGAIKNISIGLASSRGKSHIHSGGTGGSMWSGEQDAFLESMAEAGKSVVDYLNGNILYINVMNRLSVDCDCDSNPAEPDMHDIGILASFDPVALDQACIDLVYSAEDGRSLINRIESRNGLHTLEQAEKIGLGSRTYQLEIMDD